MSTVERPVRVLHVTEAMGGGIVTFLDSISRRQAAEGAEPSILYAVRDDTPQASTIRDRYDDRVKIHLPIDRGDPRKNALSLYKIVRKHARSGEYDVIHLHSSVAGGVGRIAAGASRTPLFYSPHGFAFLREDTSVWTRRATRMAERVLAKRGSLIVTSATEVSIARGSLRARDATYLQSGVPRSSIARSAPRVRRNTRPQVAMLGRMAYQKAPWRFAAIARALDPVADFTWVGGGDPDLRERWIGDAPVRVLEWVSPEELEAVLHDTDVFLFPTLWEGMSLSLIQAQGRGIPAVTTDVVGNRDAVQDNVTGYVCADEDALIAATRRLVTDAELREQMGAAAREWAWQNLTDDDIGRDSLIIYRAHKKFRRNERRGSTT